MTGALAVIAATGCSGKNPLINIEPVVSTEDKNGFSFFPPGSEVAFLLPSDKDNPVAVCRMSYANWGHGTSEHPDHSMDVSQLSAPSDNVELMSGFYKVKPVLVKNGDSGRFYTGTLVDTKDISLPRIQKVEAKEVEVGVYNSASFAEGFEENRVGVFVPKNPVYAVSVVTVNDQLSYKNDPQTILIENSNPVSKKDVHVFTVGWAILKLTEEAEKHYSAQVTGYVSSSQSVTPVS